MAPIDPRGSVGVASFLEAENFRQGTLNMIKSMMFARLRNAAQFVLVVLGGLFIGHAAAQAQQFSADIVMQREAATAQAGRLRVLDSKVRMETPEFADGFFLIDAATPTAYFVRPGARIYMDARQSSRLTQLLIPVDPAAPCRQWQVMAHLAGVVEQGGWRCQRTGEGVIDGRQTIVFRAVSGSGQVYVAWIDRERKFPLRIKADDGMVIAVENIRDEKQSAASFELPPALRKFSPEALIERIKQSDVWVAGETDKARP